MSDRPKENSKSNQSETSHTLHPPSTVFSKTYGEQLGERYLLSDWIRRSYCLTSVSRKTQHDCLE